MGFGDSLAGKRRITHEDREPGWGEGLQGSSKDIQRRRGEENFGGPAEIQRRVLRENFDLDGENFGVDGENFVVGEVRTSTLAKEDFASDEGRTSSLTKTELRLAPCCYDKVKLRLAFNMGRRQNFVWVC